MIEGYVGLIGGGKSYNATLRMLEYIALGGAVYTNMTLIPHCWYNLRYAVKMKEFKLSSVPWSAGSSIREIEGEKFFFTEDHLCVCRVDSSGVCFSNSIGYEKFLLDRFKWEYQQGQYVKLHNEDVSNDLHAMIPRGTPDKPVLCVLDESVDFFDRDDRGSANREFLSFLRHSRKQAVDLIFIAQEFTELNKRIRNQTHFIWTFWDMQTFKVPGLRTRLPPPWRNMILSQQWNRSMKGGCLKRIWRARDSGVFGCYRTDELFRSLKSADGETDFRGRGTKKNEGKKMNGFERVALAASVAFSCLGFFKAPVVSESVESSDLSGLVLAPVEKMVPAVVVKYALFQTWGGTDLEFGLMLDGLRVRVGDILPAGTVLAMSPEFVHCRSTSGIDVFFYPVSADFLSAAGTSHSKDDLKN